MGYVLFRAFWPTRKDADAFNRFACSYDLVNWTEWEGEDLIKPLNHMTTGSHISHL